jgi:hypothetical protein
MDALRVIARNFPHNDQYDETSFTGALHERQVWNLDEYWLLEAALYELSAAGPPSQELAWWAFRIFSYTLGSISAHFDGNDLFVIRNLSPEALYEFRERLQEVFEGFFSGDMPEQFEAPNPQLAPEAR